MRNDVIGARRISVSRRRETALAKPPVPSNTLSGPLTHSFAMKAARIDDAATIPSMQDLLSGIWSRRGASSVGVWVVAMAIALASTS